MIYRSHIAIPSTKPTGPTAARSNSTKSDDISTDASQEDSHDIRDYTKNLRKSRKEELDIANKTDGVKVLRKLLRKL